MKVKVRLNGTTLEVEGNKEQLKSLLPTIMFFCQSKVDKKIKRTQEDIRMDDLFERYCAERGNTTV